MHIPKLSHILLSMYRIGKGVHKLQKRFDPVYTLYWGLVHTPFGRTDGRADIKAYIEIRDSIEICINEDGGIV